MVYPYQIISENQKNSYFMYSTENQNKFIISQILSDLNENPDLIIQSKLKNLKPIKYEYQTESLLYNSTIFIYIGLTIVAVISSVFVIRLIIAEITDQSLKMKFEENIENQQNGSAHIEEEEKESLALPENHSKIEIINYAGSPEDGFIKNDNQSSKVSGSYKYSNTEEFERQISQIVPNQGSQAQVSANAPNVSAQDLLSFVNQIPGNSKQINP